MHKQSFSHQEKKMEFRQMKMMQQIFLLVCVGVALLSSSTSEAKPSFVLQKKKTYTPLVFFTAPKDYSPECDEMEKIVSEVEKEVGVRVERMDVVRDAKAKALLNVLTSKDLPYLYNRETLQTIWVGDREAIDKTRVRAWAKGRLVTSFSMNAPKSSGNKPMVVSGSSNAMDQDQLQDEILDSTLGPLQKKGKDAIKKKTAEKAKQAAR